MNSREPLMELPLDRFLPSDPSLLKSTRNKKRPLSPGTPTLFSPAKRRILSEEGFFSPEKSIKTPLFVSSQPLGSPARFADVLVGPSSPARVLDFGRRNAPQPDPIKSSSKTSPSVSRSLAPSPELKVPSSRGTVEYKSEHFVAEYQHPPKTTYVLIPRKLPPALEPSSIHYPGFTVHQDPYIAGYSVVSEGEDSAMDEDFDEDQDKENMRPRRPTRKAASTPNIEASQSPARTRRAKSFLDTPDRQSAFSTPTSRIYSPLPENFSSQESNKSWSSHRLLEDGLESDDDY
ncbi:hypothetical protein BJ165DRAFT_1521321 [Panaeolus papilionaceus]|nr:hypothetical protein BJ165DRAFT_1521321 [Panaeolus papilionaceus]